MKEQSKIQQLILAILFINLIGIPGISQTKNNQISELIHKYHQAKDEIIKKDICYRIGEYYWFERKIPEAKLWLNRNIKTFNDKDTTTIHLRTLDILANVYLHTATLDSAYSLSNQCIKLIENNSSYLFLPNIYQTRGRILSNLGASEEALKSLIKSDSLYEKSKNQELWKNNIYVKLILKDIFITQNQKIKAKKYLDLALKNIEHLDDDELSNIVAENLGHWYITEGNLDKAKEIYEKQRKKYYPVLYQYTSSGLGEIAFQKKEYRLAIQYFNEALASLIKKSETYMIGRYYAELASSYLHLNEIDNAKIYCDSSLINFDKCNHNTKIRIKNTQFEIFNHNKDYEKAKNVLSEIIELNQKSYYDDVALLSNNLEVLNRVNEKDKKILQKEMDNFLANKTISQQRWINVLLSILLTSLGFVFYFVFQRMKLRKLIDQKAIIAEERNRIINDLHDDVGSELSSIKIYSELAEKYIHTNPIESKNILFKVSKQVEGLMHKLGDIVWSLKNIDSDTASLRIRVNNVIKDLLSPKEIICKINIDENIDKHIHSPQIRRNVLLIIKEAFNNIAKYSKATEVALAINLKDNKLYFVISDNGIGFDKKNIIKGTGLNSIEKRAKDIGGKCSILSELDNGTTIEIII